MRLFPAALVGLVSFTGPLIAGPVLFSVSVIQGPSGTTGAFANSINNQGQIVGTATGPGNATVLFLDQGGASVAVPYTLSPGDTPEREFINNAGQIAGYGTGGTGEAFFGNASGVSVVPGSGGAFVFGLNNLGTFVGDVGTSAMTGTAAGIALLPYQDSEAINNLGQVTVFSSPQAFLLTGGIASPLAVFNGDPTSLNDSGQAAGAFGVINEGTPMAIDGAFIATTTGAMIIVPEADGPGSTFINNEGVVVGDATLPAGTGAYIWDPVNGLQALSSLVPAGWAIVSPEGINDSGQIIALGSFMGGAEEALLIDPVVPEPSTISMMLATIALFAAFHFARRRRA